MEPFTVGAAVTPPLWNLLKRFLGRDDVISAYFDARGARKLGDERIEVETHPQLDTEGTWYFSVKDVPEYVFSRYTVGADAAVELFGREVGSQNADARYFRWVAPVLPGRIYGGTEPPNALVEFVVVGYKPKALVRAIEAAGQG